MTARAAPLSSPARRAALASLKDRIERLAPRPRANLEEGRSPLALIEGGVLELRVEDWRHFSAAAGFALALAGKAAARGRDGAPDGPVVMLALASEAGERGLFFARGLEAFGVDPARAIFALARSEQELLWAAEEAARTKGLSAVLVETPKDARRLDLVASRRLALAAESSCASLVLIRRNMIAPPSAAAARFLVAPALSAGDADDARAPGPPRWRISIERFRPDAALAARKGFLAEWRHDRKDFEIFEEAGSDSAGTDQARTPVHVPLPALLADGAPAPSRAGGLRASA